MSPRLEVRVPTLLDIRTPRPFRTPAPAVTVGQGFKTSGFVYYTWNQLHDDPSDHSVRQVGAAPHIRGWNYDTVWRPFFIARGLTVGTSDLDTVHVYEYTSGGKQWVQLRGEAVFHFASGCNYFFSGHGYGAGHVAHIKALSVIGTKCLIGFFNFESIPQPVQWNPAMQTPQHAGIPYVLDAGSTVCPQSDAQPNLNTYRCSAIDKYEIYNRTGSQCTGTYPAGKVACPHTPRHGTLPALADIGGVHTWECDVRSNAYIQALAGVMEDFASDFPDDYDGQLWDNCIEDPYIPTAAGWTTNRFPAGYDSTAYRGTRSVTPSLRTGWKGHLQSMQELYSTKPSDFLWQNHMNLSPSGLTVYTAQDAPCRFLEFAFNAYGSNTLDTLANMKAKILVAKDNGLKIILNGQEGDAGVVWTTTAGPGGVNGTWAELFAYADQIGARDNVVCMVGRNSNRMFHQTGMVKPDGGS